MIQYEKIVYIPFNEHQPNEITYVRQDHIRCEILRKKRKKALQILKEIEEDIEEERWIAEQ
jgi:hypothetical protein